MAIVQANGISRYYMRASGGANYFYAVQETDMILRGGEVTVLKGRSGSGKTTLLSMLAGLLTPSSGSVMLDDTDLYALPDDQLSRLRNERIAVIPQGKAAVESLTVYENVLLPASLYPGARASDRGEIGRRAHELLERFGIAHLADSYPGELSGGELRRTAIVRGLSGSPDIVMADEPTGDLDDENTVLVLEMMREEAARGAAVLIVTHENAAEAYADRVLKMNAGVLTEELTPAQTKQHCVPDK